MPRAELLDDDLIEVETRFVEKEQVKSLPGSRWNPRRRTWTMPLSWAACLQLRGVFGDGLQVGPGLSTWSWRELEERVDPALALRTLRRLPDDYSSSSFDVVRSWDGPRLFRHQEVDVEFLVHAGSGALLASDMGVGKTASAIAGLRVLHELGTEVLPALVVCPKGVKKSWARHALHWTPYIHPYVVTGGAVGRRRIVEEASHDPHSLVVVNLESVRLLSRLAPYGSIALARCRDCDRERGEEGITAARCEVHRKELNAFGFRTVIVDEVHRLKDPRSKQTRACWAVAHDPTVTRRWALTGTAIANHVGDIWSVMHLLEKKEYPVKSEFVDMYGLQAWNNFGGIDIVGVNPARKTEFFRILDPRYRRVTKTEVLDNIPPKLRSQRWVELGTRQRKVYRELEEHLMARLADGELLTAANNLVKATRLLQLASSYADVAYVENPGGGEDIVVTLAEPSTKLDELDVVLDELGDRQVVVAAQSRQLIDLAAARYKTRGMPFGMLTGAVAEYQRDVNLDRFRDGDLRAMFITIDAGGTGVDGLQAADTMVIIQRSWKMIANVQLEDRIYRIGSERHRSVHIIDIIAQDTIEDRVLWPRLATKFERLEELNRDRQRGVDVDLEYDRILASTVGD